MTSIQALSDRAAIQDTMARYAHGVDTAQYELVGSCFVADGQLLVPNGLPLLGPAGIATTLRTAGLKRRECGGQIFSAIRCR